MEQLETLVRRARSRHLDRAHRHAAFGKLVEQCQDMAYISAYTRLGDAQLAQDATQEAFISAYQKLGQLRQPKAFPSWLRRIVFTQCSRLRRGKQLPVTPIEQAEEIPDIDLDPAMRFELNDLKSNILDAIDDLPEHERIVVHLFYLQGYSLREVAESLALPVTTIKKRLQYARRRLRGRIARMYGIQMMACQGGFGNTLNRLVEIALKHTQLSRVNNQWSITVILDN